MASDRSIASGVPQVFYDLIGRLVPGAIALFTITIAFLGPAEFGERIANWLAAEHHPATALLVLIGLVGCYGTAVVCHSVVQAMQFCAR